MNQKLLLRFAIGLMLLAVVVAGFQWLRGIGYDPDVLPGDSTGMIAALELTDDGARAVIIGPNKEVTVIKPGATSRDRPPVWRPDGQRLFFASDRQENVYHVYRYRPGNEEAERRTVGRRSRSTPIWGFQDHPKANQTALMLSSGIVLEFDPKTGTTTQILPPPSGSAVVGEEDGNVDQFTGIYRQLGTSFTKALWTNDRSIIVATMSREEGEVLVVQDLTMRETNGRKQLPPPLPVMAGNRIEFDVTVNGQVAVAVQGFKWLDNSAIPEEFIEDNRAKVPWQNAVFSFDATDANSQPSFFLTTMDASQDTRAVKISPNGQEVLIVAGLLKNEQFTPSGLFKTEFPFRPDAPVAPIYEGEVYEPSWSSDGNRVIYVRREGADRMIFGNNGTGTDEVALSPAGRNFASPSYSPQFSK